MFDSPVRPVLSYACEVRTGCTGAKGFQQVEQVHILFLRGLLGVNITTGAFAVLGEFGTYPSEYFWFFLSYFSVLLIHSFLFICPIFIVPFFFLSLFFSICRSLNFLSFDPFLGFARCREGTRRNKYKTNSKEQIRK